jgi:predicted Zn-dependent protease
MTYARFAAWFLLVVLSEVVSASVANPVQLPDMGASAGTVLSPEKENEVGREIMRSLHRSGQIIETPFLKDYVQRLGYRLTSTTTSSNFTFFVLDDPTINAFALPGGYVGINAGLITASRSESELAGVVAHEIAHVTQRHLARSLEESNRLSMPMTAALIAAIVLGQQDPKYAEAAIASTLAGSAQARLDFTRAHEQEADRVGMGILAQSGFDPEGMPSFFERLYEHTRFSSGESEELEFLRTHPVTVSRIADSRNRARQYASEQPKTPGVDYDYAKAILKVRGGRDFEATVNHFRSALSTEEYRTPSAVHLGLALTLLELHRISEARTQIAAAIGNKEPSPLLISVQAAGDKRDGEHKTAETYLKRGLAIYPENGLLTFDYARLLLDTKRYPEAATLVSAFVRRQKDPHAYALLAETENARGHISASHMAQAESYYLQDEIPLAIDQLKVARKSAGADSYTLSRIDARLGELKRLVPKVRKTVE